MGKYVKNFDIDFGLAGKTAVMCGGASGIGYESARLFHQKGARVIIWDINENVAEIAGGIAPTVLGIQVDVRSIASLEAALARTGQVDVLCNLAAIAKSLPAEDMTPEMWDEHISINLTGLFRVCQVVGRQMIADGRGGKILNMASQAAVVALFGHVAYATTKAGILAITRQLAFEWGRYDINVNAVSPTVINTPMSDLETGWWAGERGRKHLEGIPSGRFGEPEEVAACLAYLASDAANLINGANIMMDGGYTIA